MPTRFGVWVPCRHGLWADIKAIKEKKPGYCYYYAKPSEIVAKVCFRYLRIKGLLTVENWNSIVSIVANRVSSNPGSRVIFRSLQIIERGRKKIKIDQYGSIRPCGRYLDENKVRERYLRMKYSFYERNYEKIQNAKKQLKEVKDLTNNLRKVMKDGKHHQDYQGFTC